jgi:hypothetical protein
MQPFGGGDTHLPSHRPHHSQQGTVVEQTRAAGCRWSEVKEEPPGALAPGGGGHERNRQPAARVQALPSKGPAARCARPGTAVERPGSPLRASRHQRRQITCTSTFRNRISPPEDCSAIGPRAYFVSRMSTVVWPLKTTTSRGPSAVISNVFQRPPACG